MMHTKKTFIAVMLLTMVAPVMAQFHDLTVGGHAGVSMYLTDGAFHNAPGGTGGIDLGYALRGDIGRDTYMGIKLSASLSYATAHHNLVNYDEYYENIDYENWILGYHITADSYTEWQRQFQLEVPLFVSVLTHGVTINIGAKYLMPFYQRRKIDAMGTLFRVWYEETDVWTVEYLATGRFEDNQYHGKSEPARMPQHSVLAALEIGYEFSLSTHSRLGVQAYLDMDIWNNWNNNPPRQRLIDVEPIMNETYPVPDIHAYALTDTYSERVRYVSCGVKLYYAFHTGKHNYKHCRCMILRD